MYVLRRGLVAAQALICIAFACPASGQDQTIAQMVHKSWTGRDGAPQAITALAQTPDGLLWIGGSAGLFVFDGLTFEPFRTTPGTPALAPRTIRFLHVSMRGDLWVFPFHGPPARISHGEVREFGQVDGDPLEILGHAQEDSRGDMWAVLNEKYLIHLTVDGVWHQIAGPIAGTGHISELFIDSSDTQWIVANNLVYRRPKTASTFFATTTHAYGPTKIVEGPDGTLWVLSQGPQPRGEESLQHIDARGLTLFAPRVDGDITDVLVTPDDVLWISKRDAELQRVSAQPSTPAISGPQTQDRFELKGGILSGGVLLQDGDGSIWVAGMGGLDRFEHADLVPVISDAKVGIWFSCVDSYGDAWIADWNGDLFVAKSGRTTQVQRGGGGGNLFCGAEGRVYFFKDNGISVVSGGQVQELPLLPGLTGYGDHYLFLGLVDEPGGRIIAAVGGTSGHGLWTYDDRAWTPFLSDLALPEVGAMMDVPPEGLYLAFTKSEDQVGIVKDGRLRTVAAPIRPVGFARTSSGIVVYGSGGIALRQGDGFRVFTFEHPEQVTLVTGVVESRNGDLWLTGRRGVVRIPTSEIHAALADPSHAIASVNLQEGAFVGPDRTLLFRHSADIDRNGRLWFSMLNGVVSVDPDHLGGGRRPPQLSIRAITGDGHPINASGTFLPGTEYLDIKYFGLNLTRPRSVVYRYRLVDVDTSWVDAGSRTDAIYPHLRPGRYTFEVMASNGNGDWTAPVSTAFIVLPHFYQTWWFVTLSVFASVGLVSLVVSSRFRSASRDVKLRAEERADERIRIARDLHDTLLQGVQGLSLAFHTAAQRVPAAHGSKAALENALALADRIIMEGRDRVTRLRSDHLTDAELKPSLECLGNDLNVDGEVGFAVERRGSAEELQSHVVNEIFSIMREAITNAFRHARAGRITVELEYQTRWFRATCRDDGLGFNVEATLEGATNGHFGLRGMNERARNIGARFSCRSTPKTGTAVIVGLAARRAYARDSRLRRWFRRGAQRR